MSSEVATTTESENNTLSVIIRFHDPNRLTLLEEAIFSLAIQFWRDMEVLVMIQNGNEASEAQVTQIIEAQPWVNTPRYQVISVPVPGGFDGRSSLMNQGITNAKGRFLAFLDDDDYVYQHGYRDLIEGLKTTQAVLAAGKCRVARNRHSSGHWYIFDKSSPFQWGRDRFDLFFSNFITLNSYVIDRSRIAPEDIWFDDQLPLLEDYDFLLRLAAKYKFDFSNLDNPVCEYRYHDINSLQHDEYGQTIPDPKILKAHELIESRKDGLNVTMNLRELLQMRSRQPIFPVVQPLNPMTTSNDRKLIIELLTKQNRSLNKIVDRMYNFAHRRKNLLSVLVFCTRKARKIWESFRSLTGGNAGPDARD